MKHPVLGLMTMLLAGIIIGSGIGYRVGKATTDGWWKPKLDKFYAPVSMIGPGTAPVTGAEITIPSGEVMCWSEKETWVEFGSECHASPSARLGPPTNVN